MKKFLKQHDIFTAAIMFPKTLLLIVLLYLIPASFSSLYAAATNYNDPTGYPGSWPLDSQWIPYTSNGTNISDLEGGSGGDGSTGGTTPSGNVDIVGTYGPAVSWYGDGTNLYFRMQLSSSPLAATGSSKPFISATWNILLDTDGDGFKEFVVHVDGTGGSDTQADDIVVIYNDNTTQSFIVTGGMDTIWRQDSADNPSDTTLQTVDGEPGSNASAYDNDGSPGGPDYDFLRSRLIDINGSETYLDFQVPIAALDAASRGGPTFTATTPFAMGFSTSNSNTDPVQKDFAYVGDFIADSSNPVPFGDFVDPSGNTRDDPTIQSFSATGCGPATLTTTVLDSTKVVNGSIVSTVTTEFYYYYDANSDGIANDSGSGWYKAGDGVPTNNLAPWTLSWDSTGLPVGQYLLKVIATDEQGNVVDSSSLAAPLIQVHDNTVCGSPLAAEVVDVANTTDAAGMGTAAVNADPATSVTTTKPVIRTQSTFFDLFVRNEGSLPQAYNLSADSDGAGGTFPSGLTVSFTDTGGTPITTTPILNPGDTYQYRAVVSTTAAVTFGTYSLYFHADGVSVAAASDVKQDAVAVTAGVDIANSATATGLGDYDVNADPSSSVTTTLSAQATWTVTYPLYLNNESAINQAFNLSADTDGAGGVFPAGWTVVFKNTSGTTITSTPVVSAGATYQYSAEVTTPPGTTDATYPIFFHVDGVTVSAATDVKQDALTIDSGLTSNVVDIASSTTATGFGSAPGIDADPDTINSSTVFVEPGNVAVFNLYVTNEGTGNKAFDIEAFANNSADALPADWLPVVFKDTGGTVITKTPTLAPGDTFAFTAEVTVPGAVTELLKPIYFRVSPTTGAGGWNSNFVQAAVQVGQLADLEIVKTVDDTTPQEGDSIVYTLTLTNNGPQNAAQLEVTDVLPAGVTYVSDDSGGSYNNATGLWTPNPLSSGASTTINITATVDSGTAGSTITNTATITDSNRIDPDASNDSSNVDITVVEANLTVLKSALTTSDPVNGATNPYNIPGATILYSITVTNTGLGAADTDSVFVTDPIPANTELFVNDLGAGTGPVVVVSGTTASGLTLPISFIDFASNTDDIDFSSNNGSTWDYEPVPDADGYDANVTNIRVNPKGTFASSDGTNHPSFILRFRVRVQ
ncbi:MAG: hypothetical protein P8Y24_07685 [Gammaproteobacteria bacterium]